MKKLNNNNGSVLVIAYIVFYVLLAMATGFAIGNFSELHNARRYRDSAAAFWLAESGISRVLRDPGLLDEIGEATFNRGDGVVHLAKNDSYPTKRIVTSTGVVGGIRKTLQIEFAVSPPEVFNNAMSVDGDILIDGLKTSFNALDRTRLSGRIKTRSRHSTVLWEDRREGYNPRKVTLTYPDANNNGTPDEFDDFVQFYRGLIAQYPREEIVYIPGNGTYTMTLDSSLQGKRIVFVDGDEGRGNATILLGGVSEAGQNLTVIATGTVTLSQAGRAADSQLNIIAWSGYNETVLLPSEHKGIIFTRGTARFDNILDTSVTRGCVVALNGVKFGEVWSKKTFQYADVLTDGLVPPGFEGVMGGDAEGYAPTPFSWKEI